VREQQAATAPPPAPEPQWSLPSLDDLIGAGTQAVSGAATAVRQAAPSFTIPTLESLGVAMAPSAAPAQASSEATGATGVPRPAAPSGTPSAMPTNPPSRAVQGDVTMVDGRTTPPLAPTGDIIEGDPQGFFTSAMPYAQAAEREFGVPASLSLAIAANETGYGQRRYMAGSSNYHGIQASATDPNGVPYVDWRPGPNGEKVSYAARQASFASPLEGFRGFARFLTENPRYAPALDRYRQTGDVNELAAGIHQAGYAEDPEYTRKITSILRGIPVPTGVGEVTAGAGVRPTAASRIPPPDQTDQGTAVGPGWGTYTAETLTPNQFSEGQQQGLSAAEALAVCGPAAAVAFARANGRQPTLREAKELAQNLGVWDQSTGMYGPASQVKLLANMGVKANLQEGTDWGAVAREVQAGRPVIVDTPMHYYVVTGYDPQTGEYEFGASAGVLTRSGGKTRWRPEELPSLGMGSPRATIYLAGAN
jgi:flagellum-specific peptidoglycan hydrolase FlgJ